MNVYFTADIFSTELDDGYVDVFVTSECIHLYILCIVPGCLFQEVSVLY